MERSPQRRERSGTIRQRSRASGGAGSLAESACSAGLRARPRLLPPRSFSSAPCALLLSPLLYLRSLSLPSPASSLSPLSPSPPSLARCRTLTVPGPITISTARQRPPGVSARALPSLPAGEQTQRASVPLLSAAPRKYLLSPRQSPPLFQSHLCWLVLQWEEKRLPGLRRLSTSPPPPDPPTHPPRRKWCYLNEPE